MFSVDGAFIVPSGRYGIVVADRRLSSDDEASPVGKLPKGFWMNVLRGAIATVVIGLLPLIQIVAPVGGGALAGYFLNAGTVDGARTGALAGAIGGVGLNAMAPPRFFGLVSGAVGDGFFLTTVLLWFAVWIVTSAFGGALGARLAENRYGSSRARR